MFFKRCEHSYKETESRRAIFCTECGKVKELPCAHKWDPVIERKNSLTGNTISIILKCIVCGKFDTIQAT